MRIISGIYKGKTILPDKHFTARPTTDFARESLFDILDNRIDFSEIHALDLFSGTGAISYELISRGCRSVDAVELNRLHAAFIRRTAERWDMRGLRVIQQDVFRFLPMGRKAYDLVFADPPYDLPRLTELPEAVLSQPVLSADGIFVLEHPKTCDFSSHPWLYDHRKYGNVHFSFFRKPCEEQKPNM